MIDTLFVMLKKALKKKCVPVSAVVVLNNKIISKGYNLKEFSNNPMDHAEIIAIKKAAKKLKTWKLNKCELYITMEPCKMCKTVIEESRIKKVFYICKNKKEQVKINTIEYIKIANKEAEVKYINMLKNFFKTKRK